MNRWQQMVNQLSQSTYIDAQTGTGLAEHIYLGDFVSEHGAANHPFKLVSKWDLPCEFPALIHRKLLQSNLHAIGATGQGKSGLLLAPILAQLISGYQKLQRGRFGRALFDKYGSAIFQASEPEGMVIIDPKGDSALYNWTREQAERRGQTFLSVRLDKGYGTSYIAPLQSIDIDNRWSVEVCSIILHGLALAFGDHYGAGYYASQSFDLLLQAMTQVNPRPKTFEELYERAMSRVDSSRHRDCNQLLSKLFTLTQVDVLKPPPPNACVVDFRRVVRKGEIVYLWLPIRIQGSITRDIARLCLYCFLVAATDEKMRGSDRRNWLVVDEAQSLAGRDFATVLAQCSGSNTGVLMANQSLGDLDQPDAPNLRNSVTTNTGVKATLSILDDNDATAMIRRSGERIGILHSSTTGYSANGGWSESFTQNENLTPILNRNQINLVNNDPQGFLLEVTKGHGLYDNRYCGIPRHVRVPWPTSPADYQRLLYTPWPKAPETQISDEGDMKSTMINQSDPDEIAAKASQRFAKLAAIFEEAARRPGARRMTGWERA